MLYVFIAGKYLASMIGHDPMTIMLHMIVMEEDGTLLLCDESPALKVMASQRDLTSLGGWSGRAPYQVRVEGKVLDCRDLPPQLCNLLGNMFE